MAESPYLLVFWTDENRSSVVHRKAIVSDTERMFPDDQLIGTKTKIFWKKKEYSAEIKACGNRHQLTEYIAVDVAETARTNEKQQIFSDFNDVLPFNVTERANSPNQSQGQVLPDSQQTDWKSRYEKCREKLRKSRARYKNLRATIIALENQQEELEPKVRLGPGVYIQSSVLQKIQPISDTPEKLARNLFMALFQNHELINRSLSGGTSSYPKHRIDQKKRDAVIGFTLKSYTGHRITKKEKCHESEANFILRGIKKSLMERIRYVNKRAANAQDTSTY